MAKTLSQVAAQLRATGSRENITRMTRRKLSNTALPLKPLVKAAILNIPSAGNVPYQQPPGLRGRIADCVETWTWINADLVQVGVAVAAEKMPDGQKALPLYMEGSKFPWLHPLFGDWNQPQVQGNAPHPFFYQAVSWYGPAARNALNGMMDDITRLLEA